MRGGFRYFAAFGAIALLGSTKASAAEQAAVEIGNRRELFVDDYRVDALDGARPELHAPQPREIVLSFDKPWVGLYSGYETELEDAEVYSRRFGE